MPRLTIGMPAYNNSKTIKCAINSLLSQSYKDFILYISDDNSIDNTKEICQSLADQDSRIVYFRQPINLKYQNFGFLLRNCQTEYFMWAAGDDRWAPHFIESCIDQLNASASTVLAVPLIQFEENGLPSKIAHGTYALNGSIKNNLYRYLSCPSDNSRMYGVFRTGAGQQSFPHESFHAYDWAFSAAMLRFGEQINIPQILMYRDKTSSEKYVDLAQSDSKKLIYRVFPVLEMTWWLLFSAKISIDFKIIGALISLNIDKHFEYTSRLHPKYHHFMQTAIKIWYKNIRWRLIYPEI